MGGAKLAVGIVLSSAGVEIVWDFFVRFHLFCSFQFCDNFVKS